MYQEIGQHPGFFLFLNRLKTAVFEEGFNVVLQTNGGKSEKAPKTLAAKSLAEKASKAEEDYASDQITAAELLNIVANHYDDDRTLAALAPEEDDGDNSQPSSKLNEHSRLFNLMFYCPNN